ncbi:acyltransferase family protein [Sphingobium sp. Ant17]|uniref:acyltransferase family protein n=1 Tax=Sphingobium sp. Ant17 TaxID=1461752 RepID=UPI001376CB6E
MQTDPKRRLSGIQAGRGIAALAVVLTHSIDHPFPRVFEQAHFFCALWRLHFFFVISGYIMVVSTGDGAFQPGIFVRNRIRRVVPLYWAAIFITASLALTLPQIFRRQSFLCRML